MAMQSRSAVLRQEIESSLASRIPAALSPQAVQAPRLLPIGNDAVNTRHFCIATSLADAIAYFAISGRLVLGAAGAVGSLHDTIARAVRRDTREIVIDLCGVEQIDAAGIGELVYNYTLARAAGMKLVLENPQPRVSEVLKICRLDAFLLPALDEVEDANAAAAQ
jgi:anti-anti-sigma factor